MGASQGSADTTLTLNTAIPTGLPLSGTFVVDGEYETYSGYNTFTQQLTGILRGVAFTTPATHNNGANVISQNFGFSPSSQTPRGGVFGYGTGTSGQNGQIVSVNCGNPTLTNDAGGITTLQVNCAPNETWIDTHGKIHQPATGIVNFMSPMYIGSLFSSDTTGEQEQPIPILLSTNVVQTSGSYQFGSPIGFSSIYGAVRALPVPNIPAPTLFGVGGGACSITYEITGLDRRKRCSWCYCKRFRPADTRIRRGGRHSGSSGRRGGYL
jgi:hypothetical protein